MKLFIKYSYFQIIYNLFIKGKVTSFRNCDDIWIFYCKEINLTVDKKQISIPKLKIIALDEKLKNKKNENIRYNYNQVGEG